MSLTKKQALDNFPAFFDFTLHWQSAGRFRLEPGDGMEQIARTLGDCDKWRTCLVQAPRTVGKTTALTFFCSWILGKFPWAQITYLSSTPDVSREAVQTLLEIVRTHPFLEHIAPNKFMVQRRTEFDVTGKLGKGRSVRCRSVTSRFTGLRAHVVVLDDVEVRETVTNPEQRRKVRLAVSEAHNLLHTGHDLNLILIAGTPWERETIYNEFNADVAIKLPAEIEKEDGTLEYPFNRLTPDVLAKRRSYLRNEMLYRSQYLLDPTPPEGMMPIDPSSIRFVRFELVDVNNICMITDPAGAMSAEDIKQVEAGMKEVDSHAIMVAGLKERKLRPIDMKCKPMSSSDYLDVLTRMYYKYRPHTLYVESNFNAWGEVIRTHFQSRRVPCKIEPFRSNINKHRRILDTLCPAFGGNMIEFHERLAGFTPLLDQLKDLRWESLPSHDDAIDVLSMGVEILCPWLFSGDAMIVPEDDTPTFREQVRMMREQSGFGPDPEYDFKKERGLSCLSSARS